MMANQIWALRGAKEAKKYNINNIMLLSMFSHTVCMARGLYTDALRGLGAVSLVCRHRLGR